MVKMSSIERVVVALNHQEGDRVPMDFGTTPELLDKLYSHYKVNNLEEILKIFHIDFRKVICCCYFSQDNPLKKIDEDTCIDHWGVTRRSDGNINSHSLENTETVEDIEAHPDWPTTKIIDLYSKMSQMEEHSSRGYAVFGGMWPPFDHICHWMLGMEKAMIMMIENPDLYKYLLDKIVGFYLEANFICMEEYVHRPRFHMAVRRR